MKRKGSQLLILLHQPHSSALTEKKWTDNLNGLTFFHLEKQTLVLFWFPLLERKTFHLIGRNYSGGVYLYRFRSNL